MYASLQRQRRHARADLIEDLLTASADTPKGRKAALERAAALRKG